MKSNLETVAKAKIFDYDQAIAYIKEIFNDVECAFDESCIESFGHSVKDKKIIESYVCYNKIAVTHDGKKFYWPIQPYKLVNPNGREFSYFDYFKSY